jgi:hypothetical protein
MTTEREALAAQIVRLSAKYAALEENEKNKKPLGDIDDYEFGAIVVIEKTFTSSSKLYTYLAHKNNKGSYMPWYFKGSYLTFEDLNSFLLRDAEKLTTYVVTEIEEM